MAFTFLHSLLQTVVRMWGGLRYSVGVLIATLKLALDKAGAFFGACNLDIYETETNDVALEIENATRELDGDELFRSTVEHTPLLSSTPTIGSGRIGRTPARLRLVKALRSRNSRALKSDGPGRGHSSSEFTEENDVVLVPRRSRRRKTRMLARKLSFERLDAVIEEDEEALRETPGKPEEQLVDLARVLYTPHVD